MLVMSRRLGEELGVGDVSVRVMALTGEQGLSEALNEQDPPALIILDIMLPGMSGLELCRRLRGNSSTRDCAAITWNTVERPRARVSDASKSWAY